MSSNESLVTIQTHEDLTAHYWMMNESKKKKIKFPGIKWIWKNLLDTLNEGLQGKLKVLCAYMKKKKKKITETTNDLMMQFKNLEKQEQTKSKSNKWQKQ